MKKLKTHELGRIGIEDFKEADKMPLIVILDDIRSMHNVGSVFRTADAFKIERIILCGITPTPPHREIHKTALGATESVEWIYEKDINEVIIELKKLNYEIIGIEQTDEKFYINQLSIKKDKSYAIVIGNEITGINDQVINAVHKCIEIPQFGTKHSLNVSVAAGIVMYEFAKALIIKSP
jgi:tRNA G18 (ribose-2'-O)-methylase SpoU